MQIKTYFFIVYSLFKTALPLFSGRFICAPNTHSARKYLASILLNTLNLSAVSLIGCRQRSVLSILLRADKTTHDLVIASEAITAPVLPNTLPESGSALIGIVSEKVLGFFTSRQQGQCHEGACHEGTCHV